MKKVKKIYALYHYPPCKTELKLARLISLDSLV